MKIGEVCDTFAISQAERPTPSPPPKAKSETL